MVFITVVSLEKLRGVLKTNVLDGNDIYQFTKDDEEIISELVEGLLGEYTSPVCGIAMDRGFDLAKDYGSISDYLPVKRHDFVLQFELEADTMIYSDYSKFINHLYSSSGMIDIEHVLEYNKPSGMAVAITSNVSLDSFKLGFMIKDNFSTSEMKSTNSHGTNRVNIITDLSQSSIDKISIFSK